MTDSTDPVEQFIELLKNPRVQVFLDKIIDNRVAQKFDSMLATSELKPVKRIGELEKVTGIYQFEEFEEHDETIPEKIKELSERLEHPCDKSIELPVVPETTLEHKACAIVEHLKEKVKPRNDAIFMNSNEIIKFLKCELPEDLRLKEDIRNPRQAKKDILEKAIKLFSNSVQIIRNKSGNKVTGIALKPSVWRTDTYGC